jgi:hypothetical protein
MNQGIFGLPPNNKIGYDTPALMHPLAYVDVMNCSLNGTNSNLYYMPYGYQATGSTTTTLANTLVLNAFWIGKPAIVKYIALASAAPTIAGNMKFCIYDSESTTGLPNKLLYSTLSVARAAGYGFTTVYTAHALKIDKPGFYWVGSVFDAAIDNLEAYTGSGANPFPSTGTLANYQCYGLSTGLTFGDPPPSCEGVKFTFRDQGAGAPLVKISLTSQLQNITVLKG